MTGCVDRPLLETQFQPKDRTSENRCHLRRPVTPTQTERLLARQLRRVANHIIIEPSEDQTLTLIILTIASGSLLFLGNLSWGQPAHMPVRARSGIAR